MPADVPSTNFTPPPPVPPPHSLPSQSTTSRSAAMLLLEHEPQIALPALARLRWIAVIGQILATALAVLVLKLNVPIAPIAAIILFTTLTNAILSAALRMRRAVAHRWVVPAVLLADVLALSGLLYFTGGSRNPFAMLYLVHVAMAVIALGAAWTWAIVITSALGYGLMFRFHVPLAGAVPDWALASGSWIALVLVSVLLMSFIGHLEQLLRQRDAELAVASERAARNERLASLTTLAAGAAHELNTPLGTIAVVARELEVSTNGGTLADVQAIRDDARLIRLEVDRCRTILQRMRADVGDPSLGMSRVDIASLIDYVREPLRPEETRRLKVEWEAQVREVSAPARALEQAILVLLRNAFDASPPDQTVTLAIVQVNGVVRFEVTDQGHGMSEDLLRRAGEPFFTTREPGKGMGLGLFLVRLVAERCGAQFSIDSKVGGGTRCVLELAGTSANNAPGSGSPPATTRTSPR